jgi:hypothetical protein
MRKIHNENNTQVTFIFEEDFDFKIYSRKINFEITPPKIEGMSFIPEYCKLNRCMVHGQIRDKVRKVGSSQT